MFTYICVIKTIECDWMHVPYQMDADEFDFFSNQSLCEFLWAI